MSFDTPDKSAIALALSIVIAAGRANVRQVDLTDEELKLTGRALGFLTLITVDTEYDFLSMLIDDLGKVDVKKLNTVTPDVPTSLISPRSVAVTAGGKRGKKMRGGVAPAILILGAIVALFSGGLHLRITEAQRNQGMILAEAEVQINSKCPAYLKIDLGARPLFIGTGEWDDMNAARNMQKTVCDTTTKSSNDQIAIASRRLQRAYDLIPKAAGAVVSAAVMVANSAVAFTPPVIGAAGSAGAAAVLFVKEVIMADDVPIQTFAELVGKVDAANKAAAAEIERQAAAAELAATVKAAKAAAAGTGGRRRNTKKRVMKKRRVTRRKMLTSSY